MSERKAFHKLTAMLLSAVIVVGMTPVSALAETASFPIGASGEITALEALGSNITVRNVPLGTSQANLELPDVLTATVRLAASEEEGVLDSGETEDATDSADTVSGSAISVEEIVTGESDDSSEAAPVEEAGHGSTEITASLPVTWVSTPEYDSEIAGEYIFTPKLPEDYTLTDGVEIPQITVTVGLAMRLALTDTGADYSWYDDNPSATEFEISSAAQLKGLADIVNGFRGTAFNFSGKTIKLTTGFSLSGYASWTSIGGQCTPFAGSFKGDSFTISGLTVNGSSASYVGLFGNMTGSVSNLILSGVNVNGYEYVGGVAGRSSGSITNCAVIGGTVKGSGRVGGVVGNAEGPVSSNFATCAVSGTGFGSYRIGGIVGALYNNLRDCYATGAVSGASYSTDVGGIAGGVLQGGNVMNSFATGAVSGWKYIGGIVGAVQGSWNNPAAATDNAALNSSVSGSEDTNRVVGGFDVYGYGTAANNIAYAHMAGSSAGGTSKTLPEINQPGFFAANGFSSSAWQCEDGKLPVLSAFSSGLQSGVFPSHMAYTTPSRPSNFYGAIGDRKVTLTWSAPTIPGKSYITGYQVRKKYMNDTGSWISTGMSTSYTFTGLTNGEYYYFHVRAVNGQGVGEISETAYGPGVVPSAPRNLSATSPESGKLTVTWDPPASKGTGSLSWYQYRIVSPYYSSWYYADRDASSADLTGLTNGTAITIELLAYNYYGSGPSAQIKATPVGPPAQPTGFVSTTASGQVSLNWGSPSNNGGGVVIRYEVYNPLTGLWVSVDLNTTYTITGLTNGTAYMFSVRAVNSRGAGTAASLTATPRQSPAITSANSTSIAYGGGTFQVIATGTAPITYSLTDHPSGVIINSATGAITISNTLAVNTYSFNIMASNGQAPNATQAFTLTINRRVPVLSDLAYGDFHNVTYDGTPKGIGAVSDKNDIGISITVQYTGVGGTDYATSATPPTDVGDYRVTAAITENATIAAAALTLGDFSIDPKPVTVTPVEGQKKKFGQPDPILQYTLYPSLAAGDSLTGALNRNPGNSLGSYAITLGTLSGNANYALTLSGTTIYFMIMPKNDASFSIGDIPPQTYTSCAFTPEPEVRDGSALLTNGVDFTYSYENNVNAGTSAMVRVTGIGNYEGSTGVKTFTIGKADNILSISCGNITYGETPSPRADTNTGGGAVSYEYKLQGAEDDTYSPAVPRDAGNYTVRGTSEETENYYSAIVIENFNITKINNTLNISCDDSTYGEAFLPVVDTNISGGTVIYQYKVQGADDSTYTTDAPTDVGNYTVRGTSEETTNYNSATAIANFSIGKADNTLDISCANITYGQMLSPKVDINTGGGAVTWKYKLKGADDSTYTTDAPTDVGNYIVRGTSEETTNYNSATAIANFSIGKADNTLDISCANITYGQMLSPKVDINTGGGAVTWKYKLQGAQDSTYTTVVPTDAGDYTVRGISEATTIYNTAADTADFTISKAIPSLTLTADPTDTSPRPGSVTLTATLPAGATGTLTFRAETNTIVTVTLPDNTATFTPSGAVNEYSFTVEYSGNNNYESTTGGVLKYNFTKSEQANVIALTGLMSYGETLDLYTLVDDNSGSSTGSFSFSKINGPGEINGTTLTPTGAGDVIIIVTKAADDDYNAKSAVFKVTVNPRVITFTVSAVGSQIYTGSPVTPTPEIKDGDTVLTEGVHFTYSYNNNTVAGASSTINVIGIGGYAGSSGSKPFTIVRRSSDSESSDSHNTTIVPEIRPNQPTAASVNATAQVKNGNATLTITDSMVKEAIEKALAEAKAKGNIANGISVNISVAATGATEFVLTLERAALNRLLEASVTCSSISSLPVNMSFDTAALKQIQTQSDGNLVITVRPTTVTGLRSAFDVILSSTKDGKTVNITSLGTGTSILGISTKHGKNELGGYLYGAYLGANNQINRIVDSVYDANSSRMIFVTDHFSVYGVGYTAPSAKFTDIRIHWGKEAIDYVVGRGLLSGTSGKTFSPDTAMTRGMLVTALGRLENVDTKVYTTNSFTDVKADSAFRPYIEWAYKKGIVQGTGNYKFDPDRAVTRQEFAVILQNYAKATGYTLPVTRTATVYADTSSIGSTYKTAVTAMQQAGIMMGGTGNKFNPKASATRAEVSSTLHRYIKLTIDPATAQGWALNDAGQWFYYKDGKALIGWQTITRVKYYFYSTGVLKTDWVKDGGNWRYYYINRR